MRGAAIEVRRDECGHFGAPAPATESGNSGTSCQEFSTDVRRI